MSAGDVFSQEPLWARHEHNRHEDKNEQGFKLWDKEDAERAQLSEDERPQGGIRMKLSIDNRCKLNGFVLLSQTRAEYLCGCASFSRRLGRQTFCGGTGTGETAAECQRGLKDRRHPPIGPRLEMSDEFEPT